MLWARRLKRQLIDRQGRPGNTQQDVSTWWEMFTSLTSARITSQGRICFKAPVNQTHQNVYHCEFSRQIQTKLQPQTRLHRGYILKKKQTQPVRWFDIKIPSETAVDWKDFPSYYHFSCSTHHFFFFYHWRTIFYCIFFVYAQLDYHYASKWKKH